MHEKIMRARLERLAGEFDEGRSYLFRMCTRAAEGEDVLAYCLDVAEWIAGLSEAELTEELRRGAEARQAALRRAGSPTERGER